MIVEQLLRDRVRSPSDAMPRLFGIDQGIQAFHGIPRVHILPWSTDLAEQECVQQCPRAPIERDVTT